MPNFKNWITNMNRIIYLILFSFFVLTLFSCNIINPVEDIPTYIHIDSFNFESTPNTGTSSHKITSMWVYFDGKTIGTFELPATIPILTNKPGQILIRPGITFNGLKDIQTPYFLYQTDTLTIQNNPGKTIHFQPTTKYYPDSILNVMNVDFESGNPFTKVDGDTGLLITNNPNYTFEGSYAGLIVLDSQSYSNNILQQEFSTGMNPFIELNYKNSLPFQVGLQTTSSTGTTVVQFLVGFNPKENWNKVYIGLADFAAAYPNRKYRVVIRVITESPQDGFVALDNVKVISFK